MRRCDSAALQLEASASAICRTSKSRSRWLDCPRATKKALLVQVMATPASPGRRINTGSVRAGDAASSDGVKMYSAWLANLTPEQKGRHPSSITAAGPKAKQKRQTRRGRWTMSLNVWCFTGHLGRDAETRYLPAHSGTRILGRRRTSATATRKNTIWTKCTLFGERGGNLAQYLTKGTQVAVSGEVNLREWQDRDGGNDPRWKCASTRSR